VKLLRSYGEGVECIAIGIIFILRVRNLLYFVHPCMNLCVLTLFFLFGVFARAKDFFCLSDYKRTLYGMELLMSFSVW
jgi:hypothetical protein